MERQIEKEKQLPAPWYTSWKKISALIVFIAFMVLPFIWSAPLDHLSLLVDDDTWTSLFVFGLLLVVSTVVAPITVTPIIPVAGLLFGPFVAGVVCVVSWVIGASIAFVIARKLGRPLLVRFISEESLAWYERIMPVKREFISIVILRMMVPVDVLSYALGVLSKISLTRYITATAIGVTPFAFVYTYAGLYAGTRDFSSLILLLTFGVVLFGVTVYTYRRLHTNH